MEFLLAGIWRSWPKSLAVWVATSATIASILYAFNWHTFYDTRLNMASTESERIAGDIERLHATVPDEASFRSAVRNYVAGRKPRIEVELRSDERVHWSESNDSDLDPARTLLARGFEFPGAESAPTLYVDVQRAVRPPLATALLNAWSFSLRDYRRDPMLWRSESWINRSIPLYGYLLTVMIVGFGTVLAFHRDQLELDRLEAEADDVGDELEEVRRRGARQLEELKERAARTESQRDDAIRERERLVEEIETVERETRELARSGGDGKVDVSDAHLQAIADRKARVEQALASHDVTVASYEGELGKVRTELDAAEDLLGEVETRQNELQDKLRERNRQIRQLQDLVRQARQDSHRLELRTARHGRDDDEAPAVSLSGLETQLDDWVATEGTVQANFADHSRAIKVERQFAKIDRAFLERFFTHATNTEYERGARKLIRVSADPPVDGAPRCGQLVIALDDDAGRTLGLRYELRKNAPDASHVGFVLALLLRDHCRDFSSFSIRTR